MIRKFNRRDIREINGWYKKRGAATLGPKDFPANGWIVPGVAAIFVYLTDSSVAMIEGLVTNPDASPFTAGKSVRLLIECCYAEARVMRKNVVAIIKEPSVRKMTKRMGHKSIGEYELFVG